ncbi:MAG: circadian clock KaiB family protein [Thermoguttaceae bacterium]
MPKKSKKPPDTTRRETKALVNRLQAFEETLAGHKDQHYVLRLFVTGLTERSAEAIANVKQVCQSQLAGRYDLEVVDVSQQPSLARSEQIVATPTLVKKLPLPLRRLIGDLSDTERVLAGLDLKPADDGKPD